MKYKLFLILASLLFSCSDPKADLIKEIDTLTGNMKSENFPSAENMDKIVLLYDQYILNYPSDKASFNYMELKAKYLAANNDFPAAIKAYDDILAKFPNGDRKAEALFMQAFIFENNMADPGSAEAKYQAFIKQYPNHEMIKDAKFALENLSLSDEELFDKLMLMQGNHNEVDTLDLNMVE